MLCDSLVLRQRPQLHPFSERSIQHDGAMESSKESIARSCIREPQLPFEYPVYRSIEHLSDSLQQAHDVRSLELILGGIVETLSGAGDFEFPKMCKLPLTLLK